MNSTVPTSDSNRLRLRLPGSRLVLVSAMLVLAAAGLTACGSSKSPNAQAAAPVSSDSNRTGTQPAGGAAPAAFGLAAEISGSSIEVQDPSSGQVTVNFSAKTAFSQTKTVTKAAITVGSCVTAIGQRSDSGTASSSTASSSTASSSTGSASPGATTNFAAMSVAVSPSVNGSCAATEFGGGRGNFSGGPRPSGSERPSGAPSARPSGSRSGFGGSGFGGSGFGGAAGFASGKVTQLSGDTMLVQVIGRGDQASTSDTITLTASTTYTETDSASATALKVGECVTATGTADATGAVAATKIGLSTAGPDGCSSGFGRRSQATASSAGA